MIRIVHRPAATAVLALACLPPLSGCAQNASVGSAQATISVVSRDDACELNPRQTPAGVVKFAVANKGSQESEFYLLAADGNVVGEVEDIGPGLTRELKVTVTAGDYLANCKPGMKGAGQKVAFQVTS